MRPTIMDAGEIQDLYKAHVSTGRAKLNQLMGSRVETRSSGCLVYDSTERDYLDCGGAGVFFLGHGHPDVVAAVTEKAGEHALATRMMLEPTLAHAARELAESAPAGLSRVQFTPSGAEATELAIKIARLNGKSAIVAARGAFHGKTMGALTATGNERYREQFTPLLPEADHVPFGDAEQLDRALASRAGTACVFLEPIQGIGGVVLPPPGYLADVRRICDEHDALLVFDEILTGLGRAGSWWTSVDEGAVADVLLCGKALTGGVAPIAAAIVSEAVFRPLDRDPFLHFSTFTGAPIATAAARAALEVIRRDGLVERANDVGEEIQRRLRDTVAPGSRIVADLRGRGLLIGIELAASHIAGDFASEMLDQGVIVNPALMSGPVVTLTPPAVIGREEIDRLISAFAATMSILHDRYASDPSLTEHATA